MSAEFKWYASADSEIYQVGPCDTREEAIAEAERQDLGLRRGDDGHWSKLVFFIIEASKKPVDISNHVDFDAFIENLHVSLDDNHGGEDGGVADGCWTEEQEQELGAAIEALVHAWQAKHNIVVDPWIFTASRNSERVERNVPLPIK